MSMMHRLAASVATVFGIFAISTSAAVAGVAPPISVPEPVSMALLGAGVGALYLVKKWRG